MRKSTLSRAGAIALCLCVAACAGEPPGEEPEPLPPPTTKDGRHFLADKPLKTFPEKSSEQWKREEAMKLADQRASSYKYKHMAVLDPDSPDPIKGQTFDLERALSGLEGQGPVVATFETTEGSFTCTLDTAGKPGETAHFVGLARGTRPWWDSAVGKWSTAPFYNAIPIYKVVPGMAFYSGCPLAVGFAEVGFRTAVPREALEPVSAAYQLALVSPNNMGTFGAQFLVTAADKPAIEETTQVIGTCDGPAAIQAIAGLEITKSDRPIKDVILRRVTITR
jgi:peptidyl-prolyl cis-trans isomerase A (cyclophilin A)